jgi:hypothetical protein
MAKIALSWKRPLVEFVAIFAGVSLSLLADDWRDGRNDRRDEVSALRLIHAELGADSADLAGVLPYLERHHHSADWLMRHEDRTALPADSVAGAVESFFIYTPYAPRRAAFDNLKDTDRLGLIEDDSVRIAILEYYERRQAETAFFLQLHDSDAAALRADWWAHVRVRSPAAPEIEDGEPRPRVEMDGTWPQLRADRRLLNLMGQLGNTASASRERVEAQMHANAALRRLLRSYRTESGD